MSQYTTGPWTLGERVDAADRTDENGHFQKINSPLWSEFASVVVRMADDKQDSPRGLANAALIVSAPEMLEALHQYESDLLYPPTGDSRERRLQRVRAVIAKATGDK